MTIKRQTVVFSLLFNADETYAESAAEAISHCLFNEEGMLEWDHKVTKEESLSATLTDGMVTEALLTDNSAAIDFLDDTSAIMIDYDGEETAEGLRNLVDEVFARLIAYRDGKIDEYNKEGVE